MYQFILVLLLGLLSIGTSAQKYSFKTIKTIEKSIRWMEVDKMKHLYLIADDHTLLKYSSDGTLLYQFNENSLGEISYVDISNPFRILAYYADYATVIVLDRTLSETRRHDLSDLDIPLVQALGIASDNNIWLFDNNSFSLKKIDNQNQTLVESSDLNLLLSEDISPTRLVEYDGNVYLNAPNIGVLVFDIFSNYIKTIELTDLDYFQLYERQLFYVEDKKFKSYNLLSFLTQEIELPILHDNLKQLCIAQEHLYINYPNKIEIIALKKK